MASTNSYGIDNVTKKELCLSSPEILPALVNIFNLSLDTGTFPNRWKQALITPVHKKGDKSNISNYQYQFCRTFPNCLRK